MERIKNILVNPNLTIKQTLRKMDETGKKIIFVTNINEEILGVVTDGDIRRWILKGNSLSEKVSYVMNVKPIVLKEGFSKDEAKKLMLLQEIDCVPVIDKNKKIISALWWMDLFEDKTKKRKEFNIPVVIMAGGEGTRLSPFTKILPKPLMPIGEKPILEVIISKFVEYGCKNYILSVNYKSNIIKAYFNDIEHKYKITYLNEKQPLGTAGSLFMLKNRINKTFFVTNCDILIEADYADILTYHREQKNSITLVVSVKHFTIPYGICDISNGGKLNNIREKPEFDYLVNTGMYVLEPSTLNDIPENKHYNITDLINSYLKADKKIGVYPVSEKSWLDMGQWEELQNMIKSLELKI